jgi:hypothetical protein
MLRPGKAGSNTAADQHHGDPTSYVVELNVLAHVLVDLRVALYPLNSSELLSVAVEIMLFP